MHEAQGAALKAKKAAKPSKALLAAQQAAAAAATTSKIEVRLQSLDRLLLCLSVKTKKIVNHFLVNFLLSILLRSVDL